MTIFRQRSGRQAITIVAAIAITCLFVKYGNLLTLESLATREVELRSFQEDHPILVLALASLIYIGVTAISLPVATGLSLLFAWYFDFWVGLGLISFSSTAGATLAFLMSRSLFRDSMQRRFGHRLEAFNRSLEEEGALYLFSLRLAPVVPFFMINVVMGLTPIRTRTFWWVSQVGMLPATAVYVYAGSTVPDLETLAQQGVKGVLSLQLILAFALLGVFPLVAKRIVKKLRPAA